LTHYGVISMGIKSGFKKTFGTGLNPKQWVGSDQLKKDSKTLAKMVGSVLKRSKKAAKTKETFEEAVSRFNLTPDDIKKRMKSAKEIVMILLVASAFLVVYAVYQWFFLGHFIAGFTCLILTVLTLSYAFREHFHLFQMRQRRLGCSYKEWLNSTFKRVK
jgi:intracellular multiplication protein IcmV